jgi:hypothetical protein
MLRGHGCSIERMADLPDTNVTAGRLLLNQADSADAVAASRASDDDRRLAFGLIEGSPSRRPAWP